MKRYGIDTRIIEIIDDFLNNPFGFRIDQYSSAFENFLLVQISD